VSTDENSTVFGLPSEAYVIAPSLETVYKSSLPACRFSLFATEGKLSRQNRLRRRIQNKRIELET
jgi:hypothetical protein